MDPNSDHPPRQSMPSSSNQSQSQSESSESESMINQNAVLIIPLDNRVTPEMVADKFVKYGKILQVRPIKKSSTCIVIFSRASEAANCIRLFQNHDKVRVTRPDQKDWNLCGESIPVPLPTASATGNDSIGSERDRKRRGSLEHKVATKALEAKIADHETQQSRVSIMYRQRAAFQLLHEKEAMESKKRAQNNEMILGRLQVMHSTADELHCYLKRMVDLESTFEENVDKAVESTFGLHENGGSVHSAGIAIEALLKNRLEQFRDIKDRVFSKILVSSQKYRSKLKQQMAYFEGRIRRLNDQCEAETVRLNQQWNKYQNVLHRALKAQQTAAAAASSPGHGVGGRVMAVPPIDPFLIGRGYDSAQRQYEAALREYNEEMTRLFNKMMVEDKKRIDGIKTILIDYFLAEKAKAMNHVKLIESSLEYIKCIDKEHDTNDFIKRFAHCQNHSPSNKATDTSTTTAMAAAPAALAATDVLFNFCESDSFRTHSQELTELIRSDVVLEGKLYRPGRILSSNWKPVHGAVTKFGFFHCFTAEKEEKPTLSVPLHNTSIVIKDQDKKAALYTLEIVVPNSSWFSLTGTPTKHFYRAETAEEFAKWVATLKRYTAIRQ